VSGSQSHSLLYVCGLHVCNTGIRAEGVCVPVRVCVRVRERESMCVSMCVCPCVFVCPYPCVCVGGWVYVRMCMYVCMRACVRACEKPRVYVPVSTYTIPCLYRCVCDDERRSRTGCACTIWSKAERFDSNGRLA